MPLWEWKLPDHALARGRGPDARRTASSGPASCSACGSIPPSCRSRSGASRRAEACHERAAAAASCAATADDPLWYKDAIIYQLHVKSFFDANNDGIGDFPGLIAKLDYIAELGVNTIWLLPFYPSPRRDDGYDIADYRDVHPDYGTLADFKRFVARRACARHPRHHRAGDQPHLRPASLVPARAPRQARLGARATSTSGPTPTRNTPARASSSSTPSGRTGPGTRSPAPITGTASIRTSPT